MVIYFYFIIYFLFYYLFKLKRYHFHFVNVLLLSRHHRALDNKWKEKGQLIDQLEGQVRQVKNTFDEKELSLRDERDKALKAEK